MPHSYIKSVRLVFIFYQYLVTHSFWQPHVYIRVGPTKLLTFVEVACVGLQESMLFVAPRPLLQQTKSCIVTKRCRDGSILFSIRNFLILSLSVRISLVVMVPFHYSVALYNLNLQDYFDRLNSVSKFKLTIAVKKY